MQVIRKSDSVHTRHQKPYDKPHSRPGVTAARSDDEKISASSAPGTYDKNLLAKLVLETAKLNARDWDEISSTVGQTLSKNKDLWRKVIKTQLIAGKEWSKSTSPSWTNQQKIALVNYILDKTSVNWDQVARSFPGKSPIQVKDVWRKVLLPKIRRGDPVN
ncbi:hypothetical protein BD324DRAFT_678899 [Kockovaella imperatae]|uniref:Myb-like domain-containing protein n=1 Tax=Kockovaella imperatae TaxID=4999 RepID=A0A1Y1UQT4_9TREE|nr:hypothetical protein BD324DRAFT_678899 [Kockovaella imperatae]ORX39806.1 hypothetical protein BD324DRAFT_678899 [Kockovaella imperatae]